MIEGTKSFIKSAFPFSAQIYRRLRVSWWSLELLPVRLTDIFTDIYLNNFWADPESVSGRGSTIARTEVIRHTLPTLLESVGARSLLDAACGDFNWMRHVDLSGIEYVGADIVPELVSQNRRTYEAQGRTFVLLDITNDPLPEVDVILCRDCLIHLSSRCVRAAIANFKRSKSKFLLATTHVSVTKNTDIRSGDRRPVNLELPPFNFPPPLRLITEDEEMGKHLGLWNLAAL
jgi:SAM-dependent methyltransferase